MTLLRLLALLSPVPPSGSSHLDSPLIAPAASYPYDVPSPPCTLLYWSREHISRACGFAPAGCPTMSFVEHPSPSLAQGHG